jgi:magnesium-transporting ATPase (P-type)
MTIWVYFVFDSWNIAVIWSSMVLASGTFRAIFIVRKSFFEIQKLAQNTEDAKVCRGGRWEKIPVHELVPGDIIELERGAAPCDGVVVFGGRTKIIQTLKFNIIHSNFFKNECKIVAFVVRSQIFYHQVALSMKVC